MDRVAAIGNIMLQSTLSSDTLRCALGERNLKLIIFYTVVLSKVYKYGYLYLKLQYNALATYKVDICGERDYHSAKSARLLRRLEERSVCTPWLRTLRM